MAGQAASHVGPSTALALHSLSCGPCYAVLDAADETGGPRLPCVGKLCGEGQRLLAIVLRARRALPLVAA